MYVYLNEGNEVDDVGLFAAFVLKHVSVKRFYS